MIRSFRYPLDRAGDDSVIAPVDLTDLKSRYSQIDLEIGCGVGLHPIRRALSEPDRALIAIEHTAEKFGKFAGRVRAHRDRGHALQNLVPLHLNAIDWIARWAEPGFFDTLFLLYPNPFPRERQANLRWLRMPFFARLLETIKPGGQIVLATNLEWYWTEANELALLNWGLESESDRVFTAERLPPQEGRSHFERKYLRAGETCFESVWRKPEVGPY